MKNTIKIGTRGSQLALYQANEVKRVLLEKYSELKVDIEIIHTKGDKILDVALSKIGDKGLFTKEIEVALIDETVDIAVHSLKDLPTTLPEGLTLGAVLKRAEYRDAFVSADGRKLKEFTSNDKIATSSLRRQAGLKGILPDVNIIDIRGNVNTRLKKMSEGYCDAMIMAAAGLQRLELDKYITEIIEPEVIMPAVAQGAIAIEMRENDSETLNIINGINHQTTWETVLAERSFLRTLEGGCQVPLGCYSKLENKKLTLHGFVASVDGSNLIKDSISGNIDDGELLGKKLADLLLEKGAGDILKDITRNQ